MINDALKLLDTNKNFNQKYAFDLRTQTNTTKPLLLAMPDATNLEWNFWKDDGTVMDDYHIVT